MESNFVCCICHKIPSNVVESACCNSLFCWNCVLGVPQPCPSCGSKLDAALCTENLAVKKIIDAIEVSCSFAGCVEKFYVSDRSTHEATCPKGPSLCPNSDLCGIIERGSIAHHLLSCQYRQIECHMCEMTLPLPNLQEHLDTSCEEVVAECQLCRAKLVRKNISRHIETTCPSVETECPFACYGCNDRPMRIQADLHMHEHAAHHMRLMVDVIRGQQSQIDTLRQQLAVTQEAASNQYVPNGVVYKLDQRLTDLVEDVKESRMWNHPGFVQLRAQITMRRIMGMLSFLFCVLLLVIFLCTFMFTGLRVTKSVVKFLVLVKLCSLGVKHVWAGAPWVRHRACVGGIVLPVSFLLYLLL